MLIHKGKNYIIEAEHGSDGTYRAYKTAKDGSRREGIFYPERDCTALAGDTDEYTAWMIIRDVATQLASGSRVPVDPSHIMIAGAGSFKLCEWCSSHDRRFMAPEGYEPVWALGATVFYLVLGCPVFQGGGGGYQQASTPVPMMRRNTPELSALVGKCLCFKPSGRPSVLELKEAAVATIKRIDSTESVRPFKQAHTSPQFVPDMLEKLWPEEMI